MIAIYGVDDSGISQNTYTRRLNTYGKAKRVGTRKMGRIDESDLCVRIKVRVLCCMRRIWKGSGNREKERRGRKAGQRKVHKLGEKSKTTERI